MKVLQINARDSRGGAAKAALRLHKMLQKNNIESNMLVYEKATEDDSVFEIPKTPEFLSRKRGWDKKNSHALKAYKKRIKVSFHSGKDGFPISTHPLVQESDVIHLHWINDSFFALEELNKLIRLGKKIVWTFHDSWPFTGGCHVRYGCENYLTGCGNCKVLASNTKNDLSREYFEEKRKNYNNISEILIISPSKWLQTSITQSPLFTKNSISQIPNLLDDKVFKPRSKNLARKILNLDKHKRYICFGAMYGNLVPYKGWRFFEEALNVLYSKYSSEMKNVELITFGGDFSKLQVKLPCKITSFGVIDDEHKLSLIYNSADMFVAPSLEENSPYTVLESIFSGTPVVAFAVGGIPEIIEHRANGYLATPQDSHDLAAGIRYLLSEGLANVKPRAYFDPKTNFSRIVSLYKS